MRRNFALVHNPAAGVAAHRRLTRVVEELSRLGAEITPLATANAADATAKVRALAGQSGYDAVIAAGGDGTFRAVAAGAAGTALPVGLIPLGTGNVMMRELRLPRDANSLAKVLMLGGEIRIEAGLANGAPFFLMAGAGYDARIVAGLNQSIKRRIGRAAFTAPVLGALLRKPQMFDVTAGGKTYEASWVIVSKARHYGGSFVLSRDGGLDADDFSVFVVTGSTRRALVAASLALAGGRIADMQERPKGIVVLRAAHVTIGMAAPVPLEIDGDKAGFTPVEIAGGGLAVRLIVPPA